MIRFCIFYYFSWIHILYIRTMYNVAFVTSNLYIVYEISHVYIKCEIHAGVYI